MKRCEITKKHESVLRIASWCGAPGVLNPDHGFCSNNKKSLEHPKARKHACGYTKTPLRIEKGRGETVVPGDPESSQRTVRFAAQAALSAGRAAAEATS